jgi:hypothetical protein
VGEQLTQRGDVSITRPAAYHFRFDGFGGGWAIFTVNDETGEFTVQSDWGVYGYRWHTPDLPTKNLTRFLASKGKSQHDCDYITSKLQLGTRSHELEEVVDLKATRKALRYAIGDDYSDGALTKERVPELLDEIDSWESDGFVHGSAPDELVDHFSDHRELFECIRHKPSGWYRVLTYHLLPFFCRWLRENVVEKREVADG